MLLWTLECMLSFRLTVFSRCMLRCEIAVLHSDCASLYSLQQYRGNFSTPYPKFIICRFFNHGHSDWCETIPHCSFDLHFSFSPSVCLFWRSVCLDLLTIFGLGCSFFWYWTAWVIYILCFLMIKHFFIF